MPTIDPTKIPGARKTRMPDFVPPQLATLEKQPPTGDHWLHELKFDGYRMVCHVSRGKSTFWSRNGKDWTEKFPNLAAAIKDLPVSTAILDGEVVVVDKKGRSSFQQLQQSWGKGATSFVYQLFDLIYIDGYSLMKTPLVERKKALANLLAGLDPVGTLRYSDHIEGNGKAFFEQACKHEIEGIVSKLANAPYESTRTKTWLKVKCNRRQEFVIVGYTDSKKGFPGFGSLVLGVYEKGKLVYAGRVGTGFSIKQRVELRKKLDQIAQDKMPFATRPKDPGLRNAHWAKPKLIGEVEFTEWTTDNIIRHPSFQGLREDKKAAEVVREG